jgi:predicted ATPase
VKRSRKDPTFKSPFLTRIELRDEGVQRDAFPFSLPVFSGGLDLRIDTPITFFVGENGSGKSTLLEALAWNAGFGAKGGNRDHRSAHDDEGGDLGRALRLAWRQKVRDGFFMRAETFFDFASYLESVGSTFNAYGGQSLHAQSHGEAFLAVFQNRFQNGLYLLDEPEAALSPQRQLAFLGILHDLTTAGVAQFIIATHSPILLAFPGAVILSFDGGTPTPVAYRDTDHFRVTRDFLEAPERFFRYLLDTDANEAE